MASKADQELVSKFCSFLRSQPDICEGGVEALWLALTTQWGADESVPSRPFPSPRHHIPSLTRCTDIRKKSSGDSLPTPNSNMPTQKNILHCAAMAGRFFFVFFFPVLLRSCRAVTVMGRTVQPDKRRDNHHSGPLIGPVWAEKTLMGWGREGVSCTEKLVSPGQPLWLSVPAWSSPSHPTYYPSRFFSSCSKDSFLGKGDWLFFFTKVWYLKILSSWLNLKKKMDVIFFVCVISPLWKFFLLPIKCQPWPGRWDNKFFS